MKTLEMPLINWEINLILTWSAHCIISSATGTTTFGIIDKKLYVPILTLLTQDNAKLLQQLKSDFKRTIYWNKHQSKVSIGRQKQYLGYLIDPSFQGVNRLFVLSSEDIAHQARHIGFFLPKVEIKDYNVMINGQNFFDQQVKNDMRTYDNIQKITTVQGDDYTTGCLRDYLYFNECCKLIAIDLSKQQVVYADPETIQQINFNGNLLPREGTPMVFIIGEAKKTILDFLQGAIRVL